jgi:hypothetical protein
MSDINLWEVIVAKFDKIDNKLDSIEASQAETNIILDKQEVNIAIHVKRTNILEDKIVPIEKFMEVVNGILKAIGGLAILISIVTGIIKIVQYIHS